MRFLLASVAGLSILSAGLAWASATESVLNGTTWVVNVSPDPLAKEMGEKEFRDTLSFVDGKVRTDEGPKLGFEPSPYKMSRSGEKDWSFSAEQKSGQGTYAWSGTAHGDDIRGKLVWTKSDRSVLTYTFKGNKKK